MRILSITLMITIFIFICFSSLFADTVDHRNAAITLLEITDVKDSLNQTFDQIIKMKIKQDPQFGLYEGTMRQFLAKYMGWQSLREDLIKLYMDEFSESELLDMVAFYKTPTGQKALKKAPTLFIKAAEIGQKRVQDHLEELAEMLKAETQSLIELKKKENNTAQPTQ